MTDAPTFNGEDAPLSEASFLILAALCEPRHGYAVITAVETMSGGRLRLGPGTLYGALTKMTKRGWIERLPVADGEDERRKPYRLTDAGEAVLRAEIARVKGLASVGTRTLTKLNKEARQ